MSTFIVMLFISILLFAAIYSLYKGRKEKSIPQAAREMIHAKIQAKKKKNFYRYVKNIGKQVTPPQVFGCHPLCRQQRLKNKYFKHKNNLV